MAELATEEPITTEQPVDEAVDQNPADQTQDTVADVNTGDANVSTEPTFSEDARSYAETHGLDPSYFKDETALYNAGALIDRRLSAYARQFASLQQPGQAQQQQAHPPQSEKKNALDLDKLLPADQYDESIRSAFKALHDHYGSQLEGLSKQFGEFTPVKEQVTQFSQYLSHQQEQQVERTLDDQFSKLGTEWQQTFGQKAMRELPPGPQRDAREAVCQEMSALYQADLHLGRQPGSSESYFKRALGSVFGHNQQAIARTQIVNQLASRKNAALPGANGKQSKPLSGEDRAWATYQAKAKEYGLSVSDE